jgi:hypothetical protein
VRLFKTNILCCQGLQFGPAVERNERVFVCGELEGYRKETVQDHFTTLCHYWSGMTYERTKFLIHCSTFGVGHMSIVCWTVRTCALSLASVATNL